MEIKKDHRSKFGWGTYREENGFSFSQQICKNSLFVQRPFKDISIHFCPPCLSWKRISWYNGVMTDGVGMIGIVFLVWAANESWWCHNNIINFNIEILVRSETLFSHAAQSSELIITLWVLFQYVNFVYAQLTHLVLDLPQLTGSVHLLNSSKI